MTDSELKYHENRVVSEIVGCSFLAYNYFHSGWDEIVYEAGLKAELEEKDYIVYRQHEFPIYYKGKPTGVNRRIDLVATEHKLGNVILELKAIDYIGEPQRIQLWSYMRLMGIRYGMLINFAKDRVYTEAWKLPDDGSSKCLRI